MKRFFPTAFIILVSGLTGVLFALWYQSWQEINQFSQQQASLVQTIEAQNELQTYRNLDWIERMTQEVEDEIKNENKLENKGLIDTLKFVRARTASLLEKEEIRITDLEEWKKEQLILLKAAGYTEEWIEEYPPFERKEEVQLPIQFRYVLLLWEEEVYIHLNMRLGITYCNFGNTSQELILPKELIALAEDHFVADLWMGYEGLRYVSHPERMLSFQTTLGKIVTKPGEEIPQLMIPTYGLLAPEENQRTINFELTVRFQRPKELGGYWDYTTQHSLRVVRPASD